MTFWLLREDRAKALAEARRAGLEPTAEQRREFATAIVAARESGRPRPLTIAGDVAEIRIEGVLTKDPDIFAMWFGGGNTAYTDIAASLAVADSDPQVKRCVLNIDSPGGHVDGLFDALAALESFGKPLTAKASEACSAAFAIACMAKTIEAANTAAMFGSIGVAMDFTFWSDMERISVTSTEAPDKRPDPRTPEGFKVVQKHLDDIHALYVDPIARGRKTTVKDVNANYGRGAVVLAAEAKERGMIDSVAQPVLRSVSDPKKRTSSESGSSTRKTSMTEQELQDQHPKLYSAIVAIGKAQGTAEERDRATAHLTAGEQSGDMKTAIEAVNSGAVMTQTLMAKYMMAGINRNAQVARQTDDKIASTAVDGVTPSAEGADLGDAIVAIIDQGKKKAG